MINHLLIICFTITIYELIKFVNFKDIIKSNLNIYKKIIKLFTYANASDFRKQKLIFRYSKLLLIVSFKIFAVITSILVTMFIINLFFNSFFNAVISVYGIIEITIIFIIYHQIRKKINAKL